MRYFSPGVAIVAIGALALAVRGSLAGETLGDWLMSEGGLSGDVFQDDSGSESLSVKVALIQGIPDSDLKLLLRGLYSTAKDALTKQIFPVGSLEAMQNILNGLGSVDDEQRDVNQFMWRYAYLLAKLLEKYTNFYNAKLALSDPQISADDYKKEAAKLPDLAAKWTETSQLLVEYLNIGSRDLKDKWDQRATTDKQLRDVLQFFERLVEVYEAQQRLFRSGYALTQLRYMQHPDRQADLTLLLADPRQKQALADYEEALENIRESTHQARKVAARSVNAGFLDPDYLALLPFPADRQREEDDLPHDEM